MSLFNIFNVSGSAMSAQAQRLNTVASNLANADSAGVVLGARVPIILTSRADSVRSRIASCAVAVLAAHARRQALQTVAS